MVATMKPRATIQQGREKWTKYMVVVMHNIYLFIYNTYTNIRCCSAGVYTDNAVRLKYMRAMLFCLSI